MAKRELELEKELYKRSARDKFKVFLGYTQQSYQRQWFHTLIADKCQQLIEGNLLTDRLMIFVPPQHGKLLPADTPVLTTEGWKAHGDLVPGDYVFGQDGKPHSVIANSGVYDWNVEQISFSNGQRILAAKEHLWRVWADHDDHKGRNEYVYETQEIFARRNRRAPYIQCAPALEMPERELPIDPYVLGAWLGDGLTRQGVIVSGERDVEHFSALGETRKVNHRYYRIRVEGLTHKLNKAGILYNKHIPTDYLLASEAQRRALICGLMDTDGTVDTRGNCEFTQKSGRLAEDVYTLLRTLGYKARKQYHPAMLNGRCVGEKTRIFFNPDREDEVFRLPRKADRLRNKKKDDRGDKYRLFIEKIEPHGIVKGNCIQVEGGMYLAGKDLIPTHNSEIVSRKFPAWALGVEPRLKIVGTSYSADLAQQFSRSIQRTIDSPEYGEVFPNTFLNSRNTATDAKRGYLRNVDIFETVGFAGFYKAVGVGGSLTGTPADLGIIDDPIKDAVQASSQTYRDRLWDWYTDVFLTRLHNGSKIILIQTRWHADDLAGRLLASEADKWTVINIPAIREDTSDPEDPREVGGALWEERHSLERLREIEKRSPRTFAALYQQRPTIDGGNIVKDEWFGRISIYDFEKIHHGEPIIFFVDTAYTEKTSNDPSGIIATCKIGQYMYITHAEKVYMKFPELLRFLPTYVHEHGYTGRSSIRIEPKANGLSVIDQLRESTGLNVVKTPSPKESKETRLNSISPTVESRRVILVEGPWNAAFLTEVCGFPAQPHDEYVDVLCYAADFHLIHPAKPMNIAHLANIAY